MRASTIYAVMVGATLSVAPTFSLVWAQQSNQQASLLLEMQALRAEIADLRDMVERQDHQLRQMQKAVQARPAGAGSSAGYEPNVAVDNSPAPSPLSPVQDAAPATATGTMPGTPAEAIDEEVAPAFAEQEADFYQPYTAVDPASAGQPAPAADGDRQVANAVVIEDRVVGPRPVQSAQQSQRDFPPVEERRVGEPVYQAPSNPQPQVTSPVIADGGTRAPGGVIAVPPAGNTTATDRAYTTPPQIVTTTPARQTTLNQGQGAPAQQTSAPSSPASTSPQVSQTASVAVPATVVTAPAAIPTVLSEQDFYQQGFDLLKQSKHAQAVDVFKQQISNYPQGDFADDAHYWIAESMYVNRDLTTAKRYFKAIIDGFAQSPRLPDAMLKTAYIEQEQGNQIEARILLQEIIQYHPRSNAAISAKNRLVEIN